MSKSNVRETSLIAYQKVKESGWLAEGQKIAYDLFYNHGPLTGQELSKMMNLDGQWKRCAQLKERGLLIEVGKRKCTVTGNLAFEWDVTTNAPSKPIKRISNKDALVQAMKFIDSKNLIEEFSQWLNSQS